MALNNKSDREKIKFIITALKEDYPNLPLTNEALADIKSELVAKYDEDIAVSVIYTFTHAIFYKNSIVKSAHKHTINGVPSQLISDAEKSIHADELKYIKNEAHKIAKNLRSKKIKTPLTADALHELECNLIEQDEVDAKIAKKAIYSFINGISYQRSIIKASNKFFFDLKGNETLLAITQQMKDDAKEKWIRFNHVHNPRTSHQ